MGCLTIMKSINRNISNRLKLLLNLEREPVGIRFLMDEESYEQSKAPDKLGTIPYCTTVRNAMNGQGVKLKAENFACLSAGAALGIVDASDGFISGKANYERGLYSDLCVSRQVSKSMVYFDYKVFGVEILPLGECDEEPNVVILTLNPYSLMRFVQGYGYYFGHLKNLHMIGMNAICQELTSYVHEENTVNISPFCAGTRAVSQWKDYEMGAGIPYGKLERIVDGIEKTLNPMTDNYHKKEIISKMEDGELDIRLNENYYRGVYRKPSDLE